MTPDTPPEPAGPGFTKGDRVRWLLMPSVKGTVHEVPAGGSHVLVAWDRNPSVPARIPTHDLRLIPAPNASNP
jgi:hypothetical protein